MNKNVLTVMKKEFLRFFGDSRMVITALIMPGLMIYVVYTFLGVALTKMLTPSESHIPSVYAVNMPASVGALLAQTEAEVSNITAPEVDGVKEKLSVKEADLLLIFTPGFDAEVEVYDVRTTSAPAPNIEMYYNSVNPDSMAAFSTVYELFRSYEESLTNKFDVNRDVTGDLATQNEIMAFSVSAMLPFILMMMMFSGCMSLAPESIAGEKERGTIATILVTPIKRSELAVGKILSLGALAFLCGLSSCIGVFLSLPKMMNIGGGGNDVNMNIYAPADYVMIAVVVLSTVLFIVTAISIISAFAKTVKEASTTVMPLMILVMIVGISSMFGGAPSGAAYYLIPLYNSVQAMAGVFKFDYSMANAAVAVVSNLVYACAGGVALTRMFNSERVIFSR